MNSQEARSYDSVTRALIHLRFNLGISVLDSEAAQGARAEVRLGA